MRKNVLPKLIPALALTCAAAVSLTGCTAETEAAADPNAPITVAMLPAGDDPTAVNPTEVFAELLAKETGREVKVTDVPDYLSVVEAIRSDHIDIGIMSGFPSALAVGTGKVDALVAFNGDDKPVSTCVVLNDSPIQKIEDFKGKKIAFADQASSSGYFMPVYMLHEAGLEQGVDYDAVFSGGHEGSFAALEQGQVDAACTANVLTQMGEPMFPFKEGEWRGIGQSPAAGIAGTILGRQSLDDATRTQIQDAVSKIFVAENAEQLGAYAMFASAGLQVDPKKSEFEQFSEIAAVAGVELGDLE
ncbi:phosphate/phosphite/phosphonate ABC transporter substrate-binding protein [Leucobacter sp. cx-328]|uniref:phosphate/phosphite/phosphonate ABC transporter substrate-binding protein n=1 Tax=unclassified Leucobacter TaxID=2621730 RepID=UPI00165DE0F1|nr:MULTISPECIES: phosphate/phosphite/phosphonate ABC transporter substrate-binding protein [unclassified Leucobacter]MBC9942927.1 phosphate/phosphite/phosphonate ABC transporter substrate-binding protein [Leucobacter sp. cx-328]